MIKIQAGKLSVKQFSIVSKSSQVVSYEIAELIAVELKPHTLAEQIILRVCRKIVKIMNGGSTEIDFCKIPFSTDTINRRIKDLLQNIQQNMATTLANSFCSINRRNNRFYRES